jgi:hypothetical protein
VQAGKSGRRECIQSGKSVCTVSTRVWEPRVDMHRTDSSRFVLAPTILARLPRRVAKLPSRAANFELEGCQKKPQGCQILERC